MFDTLARSWEFTKLSFGILFDFKKLIFFPIISSLAFIVVSASFFVPLWSLGVVDTWVTELEEGTIAGEAVMWVLTLVFYFISYFVMSFFNTGLIACALKVLDGEAPTIGYGMSVASKRIPQIAAWALVAAVVGVLLRMLERYQKIGAWVAALLGTAWSALTFFVVPVLAVEGVGPFTAIKRSGSILRQHWGTALVSNFSVGLVGFLIMLPVLLVGAFFTYLAVSAQSVPAFFVTISILIVVVFIVSSAISAADVILKAVLYNYATDRTVPAGIDTGVLEQAFKPKD